MKLAIVGSRSLEIGNLEDFITDEVSEIVSGGAKGIDTCAREYAISRGIPLKEFLPDYRRYGKGAPIKRNESIVEYADKVLIFWDGESHGTQSVLSCCAMLCKPYEIRIVKKG